MPRILALAEHRGHDYQKLVRIQMDKLKPGEVVVLAEWAKELGCEVIALRRRIPNTHVSKLWLRGHPRPVLAMICPEPTKPRRASKRS
jgi:hypothetical protein